MKPQFTLIFCASHLWLFSSRSCNKNWQTLLDTSVKTCFESVQVTRGGVPASLSTAGLRPASLSYLSCRHLHAHMHTHAHTPSTDAWSWNDKADMMLWKNNGLKTNVYHVVFSSWHNHLWDVFPKGPDEQSEFFTCTFHILYITAEQLQVSLESQFTETWSSSQRTFSHFLSP